MTFILKAKLAENNMLTITKVEQIDGYKNTYIMYIFTVFGKYKLKMNLITYRLYKSFSLLKKIEKLNILVKSS